MFPKFDIWVEWPDGAINRVAIYEGSATKGVATIRAQLKNEQQKVKDVWATPKVKP